MRSRYMRVRRTELSWPPAIQAERCRTGAKAMSSSAWGNVGALRGMFSADCAGIVKPGSRGSNSVAGGSALGSFTARRRTASSICSAKVVAHLRAFGVGVAHAEQELRRVQCRVVDREVCHGVRVTPVCVGSQNGEANAYHKPAAAS